MKVGDRIELVRMDDDPDPIPVGSQGTLLNMVPGIYPGETQLWVKWDNGRTLSPILPKDEVKVIS